MVLLQTIVLPVFVNMSSQEAFFNIKHVTAAHSNS